MTGLDVIAWFDPAVVAAAAVAVTVPLLFFYLRHRLRIARLRTLDQFARVFPGASSRPRPAPGAPPPPPEPGPAKRNGHQSFEYVREKYLEDIPQTQGEHDVAGYLLARQYSWIQLPSALPLVLSAVPYMVICAVGISTLFACLGQGSAFGALCNFVLATGGLHLPDTDKGQLENVVTLAAVAFLGGYIFSLGVLTRALATFDLSPLTLIRVASHLITGVGGTVMAYRAFPDFKAFLDPSAEAAAATGGLAGSWYLVAFVFGLVPDLVINWSMWAVQRATGTKSAGSGPFKRPPSIPLEVIDGIDFFTRFRLQQTNIYEVQNLAVFNPILLFVETPYGLYQCIDWVAQAQLCTAVGPHRFETLRNYNIRTIFDLERAILSTQTTSQLRRLIVSLMFTTPPATQTPAWEFWTSDEPWKFWTLKKSQTASAGGPVGGDEFGAYVGELLAQPAEKWDGTLADGDPDRSMKHIARIIVDDLHVHRLRQVWHQISLQLGEDHTALPDTEPPPPYENPEPRPPYPESLGSS